VYRINRHSLRNGFNGFLRALPGDRALLPPSLADHSANLTPASGCQDHTTSPSAQAPPRQRAAIASIASRPNVRDDREAPLLWERDDGINKAVSTKPRSEIFLRRGLDSEIEKLPVGQISWHLAATSMWIFKRDAQIRSE